MTSKFEPGDIIRRIDRPFGGVNIGDTARVRRCSETTLFIEGVLFGFDPKYFELVTPKVLEVVYTEEEWE